MSVGAADHSDASPLSSAKRLGTLVIRFLFWAGWWVSGWTVLAVLLLRYPVGDRLLVTRYTGYVLPWLLVGLVPGVVTACATRRWGLAALLGTSTAIVLATYAPLLLPRPAPAQAPAPALRIEVMSYNTWLYNHDVKRLSRTVIGQRPDVVLLQEISPEVFWGLVDSLRDLYGGAALHRAYEPEILQGVISRFPVESHASLPEHGETQRAVLRSPAGPITIYNVHLDRGGPWWQRYCQAASILRERVLREPGPVILGGDFNAPDQSQPYQLIQRHLKNAHWEVGRGFGFTYPSSVVRLFDVVPGPPMVRIDHIFFSGHFVARRAETIPDSGGSDHLPVFAELDLEPPPPEAVGRRAAVRAASPAGDWTDSPRILSYACP
jgi:endonuclease/exonuclease/phosphatase family metal-dependent hydrolase